MRIGLKVSMWKRPDVFEIFAEGAHRLRKNFGIQIFVVGSEGRSSRKLCEKWKFEYLEFPNEPMGAKLNAILKHMQSFDLDYVINCGSDDLISDEVIQAYLPLMEKGYDVLGVYGLYTFDLVSKKLLYLHRYKMKGRVEELMGVAKAISKRVLDFYNWTLWDNNQKFGALDRKVSVKMQAFDHKVKGFFLTDIHGIVLDMKSSVNVHPFSYLRKVCRSNGHVWKDPAILKNKLPEYNLLMSYKEK